MATYEDYLLSRSPTKAAYDQIEAELEKIRADVASTKFDAELEEMARQLTVAGEQRKQVARISVRTMLAATMAFSTLATATWYGSTLLHKMSYEMEHVNRQIYDLQTEIDRSRLEMRTLIEASSIRHEEQLRREIILNQYRPRFPQAASEKKLGRKAP